MEKKHPVKNQKSSFYHFFVLPGNLAKKEKKEEAIKHCKDNNCLYAQIDGTPRCVPHNQLHGLINFCTSVDVYYDKYINGEYGHERKGGINYNLLAKKITEGDIKTMIFAYKNQKINYEKLQGIIREGMYHDEDSEEYKDGEPYVCAYTDIDMGQDILEDRIDEVLKREMNEINVENSYYEFLCEVKSFINSLYW